MRSCRGEVEVHIYEVSRPLLVHTHLSTLHLGTFQHTYVHPSKHTSVHFSTQNLSTFQYTSVHLGTHQYTHNKPQCTHLGTHQYTHFSTSQYPHGYELSPPSLYTHPQHPAEVTTLCSTVPNLLKVWYA